MDGAGGFGRWLCLRWGGLGGSFGSQAAVFGEIGSIAFGYAIGSFSRKLDFERFSKKDESVLTSLSGNGAGD